MDFSPKTNSSVKKERRRPTVRYGPRISFPSTRQSTSKVISVVNKDDGRTYSIADLSNEEQITESETLNNSPFDQGSIDVVKDMIITKGRLLKYSNSNQYRRRQRILEKRFRYQLQPKSRCRCKHREITFLERGQVHYHLESIC